MNDEYAPSRNNIRTAYALRLAAQDPFAQKRLPPDVERIIESYAFAEPGEGATLGERTSSILRHGKRAASRRRGSRGSISAANYARQQKGLEDYYRATLPPEAFHIPEPIVLPAAVPVQIPLEIPAVPTSAERRGLAAFHSRAAREKSRRRRGKSVEFTRLANAKPFGAEKKELVRSKREKTRRRRSTSRS